jgi:hypothetical protein
MVWRGERARGLQATGGARLLPANGHGRSGDGQRDDVAVESGVKRLKQRHF